MGMFTGSWNEEDRWDEHERIAQELKNDTPMFVHGDHDYDSEASQIMRDRQKQADETHE